MLTRRSTRHLLHQQHFLYISYPKYFSSFKQWTDKICNDPAETLKSSLSSLTAESDIVTDNIIQKALDTLDKVAKKVEQKEIDVSVSLNLGLFSVTLAQKKHD